MKFLVLLLKAEWLERPGRFLTGIGAMLVSVCLVVWLIGSYDHMLKGFDEEADSYMGVYQLCIGKNQSKRGHAQKSVDGMGLGFGFLGTGTGSRDKTSSEGQQPRIGRESGDDLGKPKRITRSQSVSLLPLVEELQQDPAVETLHMAARARLPIGKKDAPDGQTLDDLIRKQMGTPSPYPVLMGCDASWCPYELKEGHWPDMAESTLMEGVLGSGSAEAFRIRVGDEVVIRSGIKVWTVRIVGIIEQSHKSAGVGTVSAGPPLASLIVPRQVFAQITEQDFQPDLLFLKLGESLELSTFVQRWQSRLDRFGAVFADTASVKAAMTNNRAAEAKKTSAYSATGLVLASCIFIIFTTLSMGARERARRLSLLRVLGVSRRQIVAFVLGESLVLSLPAMIGGIVAGWALLAVFNPHPDISSFPSLTAVGMAVVCALAGSVIASIVPSWRASCVSPLEVRNTSWEGGIRPRRSFFVILVVIGLVAWCVQPLALLIPGLSEGVVRNLFVLVGYPCLILGTLCLAPAFVLLAERWLSPLVGRCLGVPGAFFRLQLSSNLAQSSGTIISMTVGLGLFMAIQMWGYSMLVPFTPDTSMPKVLISVFHTDFSLDESHEVLQQLNLDPTRIFPIYVEEPAIADAQLRSPQFEKVNRRTIVAAGIPVNRMMEGENPSVSFRFLQGDRRIALEQLKRERALLIPETLAMTAHLGVGDRLMLANPSHPGEIQTWKIAGVVSMPGWHWLTKTSGLRVRTGSFIAAFVLADEQQLRKAFNLERVRFFWGNLPDGVEEQALQSSFESLLARRTWDSNGSGQSAMVRPMVKVMTRDSLSARVGKRADDVLEAMCRLPLIALIIAVLAVMNTVMASVNSRKYAIGVMRASGATRGMIVRMVLGESLLLGLGAVLLSIALGVLVSWGALEIQRFGFIFGSIVPPLHVPWLHIIGGAAFALILCTLAGACVANRIVKQGVDALLRDRPE